MPQPANDAFTLGLAHDDSTRRPAHSRSRSLTRSPSPNIPFASNKPTSRSSRVERGLARKAGKRVNSGGDVVNGVTQKNDGHAHTNGSSLLEEIEEKREESLAPVLPKSTKRESVDWEVPRKLLHSSIGFLTLYLYYSHGSLRIVVVVIATALVTVIAPADIIRLHSPWFERYYEKVVGFLMRESERHSTNGVIWYIIGVLFALICYPLDIAVVSILILSWADTAASTFGRLWGRYTPALPKTLLGLPLAPRKSLAGFLAASITGGLAAAAFWGYIAPSVNYTEIIWTWDKGASGHVVSDPVGNAVRMGMNKIGLEPVHTGGWVGLGIIGIVAGVVSGIAEALDLGSLDDNLTLPIISGCCMWGFFKFLGYISS